MNRKDAIKSICALIKFDYERTIIAIKIYRELTRCPLKEAKYFTDGLTRSDIKINNDETENAIDRCIKLGTYTDIINLINLLDPKLNEIDVQQIHNKAQRLYDLANKEEGEKGSLLFTSAETIEFLLEKLRDVVSREEHNDLKTLAANTLSEIAQNLGITTIEPLQIIEAVVAIKKENAEMQLAFDQWRKDL